VTENYVIDPGTHKSHAKHEYTVCAILMSNSDNINNSQITYKFQMMHAVIFLGLFRG